MPNTKTKIRLATIFTTFWVIAINIGKREFCIPINQPEKPYSPNTAGAPQIQILKYKEANRSTSSVVSNSKKAISRIVDLHTQHYKEDFDLDKELISKLAVSDRSEDKQLLWMSRPCGTYTLREREVYLDGSHENKVWRFYQEQTNDPVLAYAISLKEVRDGKIFGNLYPLNYREHVERMKKLTCPIGNVAVAFADGNVITIPYQERRQLMNRFMPEHGAPKTMTYLPENEPELMMILKRERFKRSYHATAGNLEEYLDKLEKTTLREKLKRAKTVVSTQEVSSHKRGLER